jgi:hypothetical protein
MFQNSQTAFDHVVMEHFDIMDNETRTVLMNIDEADQTQVLVSLTSKLYEAIVEKVDDIDFGDIPATKGDITKLPNYEKLVDSLNIMEELITKMGQKPDAIITISNAIENIKLRKSIFEKGYRLNLELPMMIYSTMTLACISATSYMISTCIDFIKTPNQDGFEISLNKVALAKSKEHLLFDNLRKFNESCKKGDIDRVLEYTISKNVKGFVGTARGTGVFVATVAITALALSIIPMIRELIFFFFYSRTRVSQYFDLQADLLQMNAHNIEINGTQDKETKKKITSKQMGIVKVFRNIANFFAIKGKTAETEAHKEITNNTKKYKIDDVVETRPDSAADSLF